MCALVKFGGGVAGMSGKSGGTVFARNKAGAYARNWVSPVNPNTTKQQAKRALFGGLVSDWKALTAAQQALWESASANYPYVNRLGETSYYSGQMLFMKLNSNLNAVGATNLTVPTVPTTFTTTKIDTFTMELTASVLTTAEITLTADGIAAESFGIEITSEISGGITKPAKGLFRQVFINADGSTASTMDFTTSYIALFGSPTLGSKIFARVFMISETTGQRLSLGQAEVRVTTV
jgi:hypothetical protein